MAEPFSDDLAIYRAMLAGIDLDALDAALAGLLQRPAWQAEAACRTADAALFFPGRGESHEPAKALCAACPVSAECMDYSTGLGTHLEGVWAGMSKRARKRAGHLAA